MSALPGAPHWAACRHLPGQANGQVGAEDGTYQEGLPAAARAQGPRTLPAGEHSLVVDKGARRPERPERLHPRPTRSLEASHSLSGSQFPRSPSLGWLQ